LTRAVVAQDPELAVQGSLRAAASVAALHEALGELLQEVERLPPALQGEVAVDLVDALELDRLRETALRALRMLGRLINESSDARDRLARELSRQVNALLAELAACQERGPSASGRPAGELFAALLPRLDAGLLREALEALAAMADGVSDETLGRCLGDPVLLANLISAQPALASAALLLSARALEALKLPPEVLAGALFNMLDDVDPARVGRLVTAAARLASALHRGNVILGGHEPRLRRVLLHWTLGLLQGLDREALAEAAAALAEDLETLLRVAGDLARHDPALIRAAGRGLLIFAEAAARGLASLARDIEDLPEADLERARQAVSRSALVGEARELAVVLARSAARLPGGAVHLWAWGATALLSAWCSALEREPQAVGRAVQRAVRRVGEERAAAAVERGLSDLGRAVQQHPLLVGAVMRPLQAGVRHALVSSVRGVGHRLRRRVARPWS
jgi:hypothetical protein